MNTNERLDQIQAQNKPGLSWSINYVDVDVLVNALRAVLAQCDEVDAEAAETHIPPREGRLGTSILRGVIESALGDAS